MDFETNLINSIGDEQSRLLLDEINHGKEVSGLFLNTKYIDKKTLDSRYMMIQREIMVKLHRKAPAWL